MTVRTDGAADLPTDLLVRIPLSSLCDGGVVEEYLAESSGKGIATIPHVSTPVDDVEKELPLTPVIVSETAAASAFAAVCTPALAVPSTSSFSRATRQVCVSIYLCIVTDICFDSRLVLRRRLIPLPYCVAEKLRR